jgi:phosphatidate phosphatase APP1
VPFRQDLAKALRGFLRVASRPVRRARGRGGIVLQPYRGYGSHERVFLIGRVFRQRSMTPVRGSWDVRRQLRDLLRRVIRRPVRGALVRGRLLGRDTASETDVDGYFRLEWTLGGVPDGEVWHRVALRVEEHSATDAEAEVYIAPPRARFVVVSDIDDTVMHTGVANKAVMMWRLFVQGAGSRTAFPGVSALYRALHAGVSGDEGNPMLYVSRAPWGIYDILEEFFHRHAIPAGPVLLLREWGVSWRSPLPRRAEDHKRVLIEHIMEMYRDLPFVLIGDSGQHDPAVYREAVERHGERVLAVYIRDVSPRGAAIRAEIAAMQAAVRAAGSELVLAADTLAMAEHAAARGLIAPGAVEAVRARQPQADAP